MAQVKKEVVSEVAGVLCRNTYSSVFGYSAANALRVVAEEVTDLQKAGAHIVSVVFTASDEDGWIGQVTYTERTAT